MENPSLRFKDAYTLVFSACAEKKDLQPIHFVINVLNEYLGEPAHTIPFEEFEAWETLMYKPIRNRFNDFNVVSSKKIPHTTRTAINEAAHEAGVPRLLADRVIKTWQHLAKTKLHEYMNVLEDSDEVTLTFKNSLINCLAHVVGAAGLNETATKNWIASLLKNNFFVDSDIQPKYVLTTLDDLYRGRSVKYLPFEDAKKWLPTSLKQLSMQLFNTQYLTEMCFLGKRTVGVDYLPPEYQRLFQSLVLSVYDRDFDLTESNTPRFEVSAPILYDTDKESTLGESTFQEARDLLYRLLHKKAYHPFLRYLIKWEMGRDHLDRPLNRMVKAIEFFANVDLLGLWADKAKDIEKGTYNFKKEKETGVFQPEFAEDPENFLKTHVKTRLDLATMEALMLYKPESIPDFIPLDKYTVYIPEYSVDLSPMGILMYNCIATKVEECTTGECYLLHFYKKEEKFEDGFTILLNKDHIIVDPLHGCNGYHNRDPDFYERELLIHAFDYEAGGDGEISDEAIDEEIDLLISDGCYELTERQKREIRDNWIDEHWRTSLEDLLTEGPLSRKDKETLLGATFDGILDAGSPYLEIEDCLRESGRDEEANLTRQIIDHIDAEKNRDLLQERIDSLAEMLDSEEFREDIGDNGVIELFLKLPLSDMEYIGDLGFIQDTIDTYIRDNESYLIREYRGEALRDSAYENLQIRGCENEDPSASESPYEGPMIPYSTIAAQMPLPPWDDAAMLEIKDVIRKSQTPERSNPTHYDSESTVQFPIERFLDNVAYRKHKKAVILELQGIAV